MRVWGIVIIINILILHIMGAEAGDRQAGQGWSSPENPMILK
jgi:hypothetical protein